VHEEDEGAQCQEIGEGYLEDEVEAEALLEEAVVVEVDQGEVHPMDLFEDMVPGTILVEETKIFTTGAVAALSPALVGVLDIHTKGVRLSEAAIRDICLRIVAIVLMGAVVLSLGQEKVLCRLVLAVRRMKTGGHLRISKLLAWQYLA
jgi:hypothetical protein